MFANKHAFLCCALVFLHTTSGLKIYDHKVVTCQPKAVLASHLLEKAIKADLSLAAAFVRATFHDCITITPDHKGSGCNGSLRLRSELNHRQNRRIDELIRKIEPIVRKTCVSNADSLQLGLQISMELTGGPNVNLGIGRIDSEIADVVSGELPGARSPFDILKAFYARKGFNVREMVASDIGGHALGSFFGRQFTSEPNKFDNMFAIHVLRISKGLGALPGFNHLPSDIAMTDKEGLQWVESYADPDSGLRNLKYDFGKFLVKQSKLLTH